MVNGAAKLAPSTPQMIVMNNIRPANTARLLTAIISHMLCNAMSCTDQF